MTAAVKNESKKPGGFKILEEQSNERLTRLFKACDDAYFGGKMSQKVKIRWSKRMTECAGTTLSAYKSQPIVVSLSRPILELRPLTDLLETLLHEMIHAFIWAEKIKEKEEHGPIFYEHMKRLQNLAGVDLQIRHDFEDECDLLLKHVWRCNGPCRKTSHNRGYIRRAINRVPSTSEKWFREHNLECGGTFIKIKAPNSTKTEFDQRLDDEIEDFLKSTFPKYSKPTFLQSIQMEEALSDKRDRRRRSLSQTESFDEDCPKTTKNTKLKTPKQRRLSAVKLHLTKRKATPYPDPSRSSTSDLFSTDLSCSSSLTENTKLKTPKQRRLSAVKLHLTNRKATPYPDHSRSSTCDLFSTDSSFSSSLSDSPVLNTISKNKQRLNDLQKDEGTPLKIPKYIWQCDGKCKEKPPKFGRVERCINRPPSQREKWFLKHKRECGGTFVKV